MDIMLQARPELPGKASRVDIGKMIMSRFSLASLPASNPRLVMAVMIDEPTQNGYYGGRGRRPRVPGSDIKCPAYSRYCA